MAFDVFKRNGYTMISAEDRVEVFDQLGFIRAFDSEEAALDFIDPIT